MRRPRSPSASRLRRAGKKILISIDKIRFVMARDDYAYLQTDTDRYFSTVSLAQLEKRLDGHGFFRVHRGYLVNLSMVEEIEPVAGRHAAAHARTAWRRRSPSAAAASPP